MSVLVTLEKWSADYDAALPSQEPRGRKAAAYEAHGAQSFAATSAPPATPIADTVEASRFRGSGHDVDIEAFGTDEEPLVAEGKSRRPDAASLLRGHSEVVTASRTRHDRGHSRVVA
jgi:hypothetical protein